MTSQPLSVVIITLNARHLLEPCLKSVAFADDVLVVDSGSSDGTREFAAERGARVLTKEWLGFGRQKQFAVAQAAHPWVLCIDADEQVTEALRAAIERELASPKYHAYRIARRNRFLGRWLRHGEGYPDWSLRLFHREFAGWSDDDVHETVLTTQAIGRLEGDLLHDSADDITTYIAKQNRYCTLHAQALYEQGERAGYSRLLLSPLMRFVKFYFLRLGLLDGGPGFAHIVIGCFTSFLKYAKLIELQKRQA